MAFEINRVEVWEGDFEDEPGALPEKMAEVMRAGANLDMMISRPCPDQAGACTLFVAPIQGDPQTQAARAVGLKQSAQQWLRLEGPDRPWLGAGVAQTIADADIHMRSLTAAVVRGRAVLYLSFENEADTRRAAQVLTPVLA